MALRKVREISSPGIGLSSIQPAKQILKLPQKKQEQQIRQLEEKAYQQAVKQAEELETDVLKYAEVIEQAKTVEEYQQKWESVPEQYKKWFYTPTEVQQNLTAAKQKQVQALQDKLDLYNRKIAHYRKKEADENDNVQQAIYSSKQQYYRDMSSAVAEGKQLVEQGAQYTNESIIDRATSIAEGYYARTQYKRAQNVFDRASYDEALQKQRQAQLDTQRQAALVLKQKSVDLVKARVYTDPLKAQRTAKAARERAVSEYNLRRQQEVRRQQDVLKHLERSGKTGRQLEEQYGLTTKKKVLEPGYDVFNNKTNLYDNLILPLSTNSSLNLPLLNNSKKKDWAI